MLQFDPTQLTERENYKLLIGSVIPRPVAIITTLSETDVLNIAPFSYFNIVSTRPAILSVSVQRKNGKMKDTTRNLLAKQEAVIHVLDQKNVADANQTAAQLPAEISELTVSNFTTTASTTIRVPGLIEAKVRFETKLCQHIPIQQEDTIVADLLLLEIKHYHLSETIYHDGRIDPRELAVVSRLAGNAYAAIGEIFEIERPD